MEKFVKDYLDKISSEHFDKEKRQGEALAMLLKQNFLIFCDKIELVSPDPFKSLLQTDDPTNVDPLKYFKDFLKKQSNTSDILCMLVNLSTLSTLFYILYELKRNKIDANKIYLQLLENKKNMQKLVGIMSKLEQEDLKELFKLINQMISNFLKNYGKSFLIHLKKNVLHQLYL